MKRRIQQELQAEYEARKKVFPSYADFLEAKANESPWVRQQRERFGTHQGTHVEIGSH